MSYYDFVNYENLSASYVSPYYWLRIGNTIAKVVGPSFDDAVFTP